MSGTARSPTLAPVSSGISAVEATEVAIQYPVITNEGDVPKAEIIDNFIKLSKERCETLQEISDRSAHFSKLKSLLNTYRRGLAFCFLRKCCFYLMREEYMEMYYYATEFRDLAIKLNETKMLGIAQRLMSKKFVLVSNREAILFETNSQILKENRQYFARCRSNELYKQEYDLLKQLYSTYVDDCDFQHALDMGKRLLEIACSLDNAGMMIETLVDFAFLYLILGKYERSFDIMKEIIRWKIDDLGTKCILLINLSVVELLLERKIYSLQHAWDSLDLAVKTKDPANIACAYGNIGLALEYMGCFDEAIEPYEQCLETGETDENYRVINNALCNLGRAYEGLGNIENAKKYFKKAVNTKRPPKASWCDTEDFRFSGEYLLAKLAVQERNWDEAKKQLTAVIERCENLRKSIQDSQTKITFNDTQRKPFQLLQHVMLEDNSKVEALVVAEKGRGRDFFDKMEGDVGMPLDSENILLNMMKSQNIAVLFISDLEEVGKLSLWFISSKGELLKQCLIPSSECNKLLVKLYGALHRIQGRYEIEFKATAYEEFPLIDYAIKLLNDRQSLESPCLVDIEAESDSPSDESVLANICMEHQEQAETSMTLLDLINELSICILKPFRQEIENVINEPSTGTTPKLLVIPQGTSFNIPFSALKHNGKPLCHHLTIIEAFSFHSFAHSTKEINENKCQIAGFDNALIVGNPTHLDELPRAEEEAKEIAKIFGVDPLIRDEATKDAVLKRLPAARLIHFSCHGEEGGEALLMAKICHMSENDYRLTAKDVESMKLDADLVVLSACHTAHGKINSEGVIGLARAFQVAGARSIVTALWAIPDNATKKFMEEFYDNLCRGQPVADAICATQVKMSESEEFYDVINWGSFKVFGANARICNGISKTVEN